MDIRSAGTVTKDDAFDVSDPTDWLGTPLASLMPVEQALRCHVCKDFYNSPMTTSCCHTFCSLCIRRSLASDGKCPLCRATDQESRLRGNWAIREAVESFIKGRDTILSVTRQPQPSAQTSSTDATAQTPKRKAGGSEQDAGHILKRTRMSTRLSSARSADTTSAMIREEPGKPEVEEIEADEYIPNDGLVACPICSWRMKPEKVDRHLDTDCPGEPRPQLGQSKPKNLGFPSTRPAGNITTKPQERLSPLNYSMVKDTALRKRFQEIGISSWGSRHLLEKRHREWITIWNANCDSARPKSKSELLRDLDIWERTQGGSAPSNSHSANLGAQIKDKEFDGQGWASKHSNSFKDLIADARKSRQKADGATQEPSHETRDQPPDAGIVTREQRPDYMSNGQQHAEGYLIRGSDTIMDQSITSSQVAADQSPRRLAGDRLAGPVLEDRPLPPQADASSS
ncbi:postreplication repair E3 ubiquitin-protein ligase rad-18 [Diaporthe helianthi]|uniref:Postreplication repair E3 ubiquitin-protein ligase RAD18 n=1 Tax=Diaporthe helianthi TaxID=158607 RepID=A0A2P5IDY4_DIAHE|nr:postreplication repair E3 ubiquitin-protein ligase rad-18 [Diaporthe helianthi]